MNIQILRPTTMQNPQPGQVNDQATHRDPHHQLAQHLWRLPQPVVGLAEDEERHGDQRGAVDQGGENLGPVEAVGLMRRGWTITDPDREETQRQSHYVREHVTRVGQQGQRISD